jgi:hypothetical protein
MNESLVPGVLTEWRVEWSTVWVWYTIYSMTSAFYITANMEIQIITLHILRYLYYKLKENFPLSVTEI